MNDTYLSYLQNKSVAVVGGHDDINWTAVNSCDVVVRVNSHWLRQRGRIDVLYYSCARDIGLEIIQDNQFVTKPPTWMWLNAAHVLFGKEAGSMPELIDFAEETNIAWDYYWHAPGDAFTIFPLLKQVSDARAWTRDFANSYRFHPLTGILAVYHLTLAPIRSMYVTGMSLYRDKAGNLPKNAGMHEIAPQLQYLQDLIQNDDRVTLAGGLDPIYVRH